MWGPFVHSLGIVQWNFTRRDHRGNPGRVSGLGPIRQLASWLVSLTLEDEERPDLDLPRVVCEYADVFPDELLGLPP